MLNRLTLGPGAGDLQKVATRGVRNFIQQQLAPSSIPEPAELERALERIPSLHMNPVEIFRTYGKPPKPPKSMSEEDRKARRRKMVGVMQEAVRARVLRGPGLQTRTTRSPGRFLVQSLQRLCRQRTGSNLGRGL